MRIDVSVALTYTSPPANPFYGAAPGRDEIFAYGMRNPWRFSFDRSTGAQWVADVGQGARKEVDAPIVRGGNYDWRVFEGSSCANNDAALCGSPQNYNFPVFDYMHVNGRCSITGSNVYRGAQGAIPSGRYLYGDYCSGEIFAWDGTTQSVLAGGGTGSVAVMTGGGCKDSGRRARLSKFLTLTLPIVSIGPFVAALQYS